MGQPERLHARFKPNGVLLRTTLFSGGVFLFDAHLFQSDFDSLPESATSAFREPIEIMFRESRRKLQGF
jgi:hypothetical protein